MGKPHYPGKVVRAPAAWLAAACFVTTLVGCGATPERVAHDSRRAGVELPAVWPSTSPDDPGAANAVMMRALSLVGTPYRYGGNTPEGGFDCSGLVTYIYSDMLARRLPRTSAELALAGPAVALRRMATGDLVIFGEGSAVSHIGIYVGEGRFVHAPSSGGTVRLDRLDGPYWREHFQGARRLLQLPPSRS
jgi:cell wall-associated NlpC family hydrolase